MRRKGITRHICISCLFDSSFSRDGFSIDGTCGLGSFSCSPRLARFFLYFQVVSFVVLVFFVLSRLGGDAKAVRVGVGIGVGIGGRASERASDRVTMMYMAGCEQSRISRAFLQGLAAQGCGRGGLVESRAAR